MENSEQINKRFNEIAMTELFDISATEGRIQSMATDQRLVRAVHDELIAQVDLVFGSYKSPEVCDQNFDNARECTVSTAAHLQHEYGLSDEDTLKAVELARLDIQGDKQIYD